MKQPAAFPAIILSFNFAKEFQTMPSLKLRQVGGFHSFFDDLNLTWKERDEC